MGCPSSLMSSFTWAKLHRTGQHECDFSHLLCVENLQMISVLGQFFCYSNALMFCGVCLEMTCFTFGDFIWQNHLYHGDRSTVICLFGGCFALFISHLWSVIYCNISEGKVKCSSCLSLPHCLYWSCIFYLMETNAMLKCCFMNCWRRYTFYTVTVFSYN